MTQQSITRLTEQAPDTVGAALLFFVAVFNCNGVVVVYRELLADAGRTLADSALAALYKQYPRILVGVYTVVICQPASVLRLAIELDTRSVMSRTPWPRIRGLTRKG